MDAVQPATRNSGRWLLGVFVLAASAWLNGFSFVTPLEVKRDVRQLSVLSRQAIPAARTGKKLIIKLPKAYGFQNESDIPKEKVIQPLELKARDQRRRFWELSRAGHNVSEVFVRYEGLTPWKRVGEIVHSHGDFREAIQCQYNFLIKRSYKLYRKFRYFLPTEHSVQFGYTDTEGQLVPADDGPLDLGTEPAEMKAMLSRSGFFPAEKPRYWRHIQRNLKDKYESKKDFHRKKFWLTRRAYNTRLEAHKWYNPRKYRGRYMQVQKYKRGIVAGTGPSR
eukprot:symbB.v1.2.041255.t1/scaffold7979.1/size8349/1